MPAANSAVLLLLRGVDDRIHPHGKHLPAFRSPACPSATMNSLENPLQPCVLS